ncbi:MAG: hypothetical protein MK171_10155 [Pirellulales bacterium]|nr:hypothetical protein [Pirellulales bacterium]
MKGCHAICLVVDGLRASALGAYGNTSFATPHLDALASRSLVVDWLWADGAALPNFYRGAWQGRHAMRPNVEAPEVPELLARSGTRQWLVTDDPWLIGKSAALPFDKTLLIESAAPEPAATFDQTHLAKLLSETVLHLAEWRAHADQDNGHSLLWLHTRGLTGPWDAPLAARAELVEEGDPPPLGIVQAPNLLCDLDDPDEMHAYRIAYAAQVAVLDKCVGAFYDSLSECRAGSETLLMLLGSRGFALGEHGAIGCSSNKMFSETLHLPWLLHVCGNRQPRQRYASLCQSADVGATLLDWFGLGGPGPTDGQSILSALAGKLCSGRQTAVSLGEAGERAIRTPGWLLRRAAPAAHSPALAELYAKPDDRWEYNDVASRCPQVVEWLSAELARFEACASSGESLPTMPRNRELC